MDDHMFVRATGTRQEVHQFVIYNHDGSKGPLVSGSYFLIRGTSGDPFLHFHDGRLEATAISLTNAVHTEPYDFAITRTNGKVGDFLSSGDAVVIRGTIHDPYLRISGDTVLADATDKNADTFVIEKVEGSGTIKSGEPVYIRGAKHDPYWHVTRKLGIKVSATGDYKTDPGSHQQDHIEVPQFYRYIQHWVDYTDYNPHPKDNHGEWAVSTWTISEDGRVHYVFIDASATPRTMPFGQRHWVHAVLQVLVERGPTDAPPWPKDQPNKPVSPVGPTSGISIQFLTGTGSLPGSATVKNGVTGKVVTVALGAQITKQQCAVQLLSAAATAGYKAKLAGATGDTVEIPGKQIAVTVVGPAIHKADL